MALKSRTRSRLFRATGGTITTLSTGTVGRYSYDKFKEETVDWVGKSKRKDYDGLLPCSDYDHTEVDFLPPFLTVRSGTWSIKGAPCQNTAPGTSHYPQRNTTARNNENSLFVTRLVAQTHPFRSEFSAPISLVELLDIGSLFKLAARSYAEYIGSSYLNYKFGWVQFLNDIKTLHSITVQIERRIKEFDSLGKHGGLRRKVQLFSDSWRDQTGPWTIWSTYGFDVTAVFTYNMSYQVWGTCRWRWRAGAKVSLTKLEAFNLAVKKVFDLDELDAETIWNAIPWTWLVDYFVDVNSWLSAMGTNDTVEPYDICIMRTYKNVKTQYPNPKKGYFVTPGRETLRIKSRDANLKVPVYPPFRYPFITMNMYLVLVALAAKFHGSRY